MGVVRHDGKNIGRMVGVHERIHLRCRDERDNRVADRATGRSLSSLIFVGDIRIVAAVVAGSLPGDPTEPGESSCSGVVGDMPTNNPTPPGTVFSQPLSQISQSTVEWLLPISYQRPIFSFPSVVAHRPL
jgi:hypothetical protein